MSKAGFILYGAKGKIGNIVAQKSKAGTIIREKVDPANPKTQAQMKQRSKFITPVRFYKHSNKNLFKMAFEDKRANESDFNAFMRINLAKAVCTPQDLASNPNFPAVGPFTITEGSLGSPKLNWESTYKRWALEVGTMREAMTTIGQLSTALKAQYNYIEEGDIVTALRITSGLASITEDAIPVFDADFEGAPLWEIFQFKINSSSTVELDNNVISPADNALVISDEWNDKVCAAAAIIISRSTPEGIKVTKSNLALNPKANTAYTTMQTETFIKNVVASWNASDVVMLASKKSV